MRLSTAIVCDKATTREGLLHVLGGGIGVMRRKNFPASLNAELGIVVHISVDEALDDHSVSVRLTTQEGAVVSEVNLAWKGEEAGFDIEDESPGPFTLPLVVPLQQVAFPGPGTYALAVHLDGESSWSTNLYAVPVQGEE